MNDATDSMTYLLERFEAGFLAEVDDIVKDELLDLWVVAEDRECAGDAVFGGVVLDILHVGNDDGYRTRLESLAVDKHLGHVLALDVDILNFLGRDVLAL